MDKQEAYEIFDHYYREQQERTGAVLPDERLALLDEMETALVERGVLPLGLGEIAQFNVDHPTYAAILRGEQVSIGGTAVADGRSRGLQELPLAARLGLLVAIFFIPMLLVVGIIFLRQGAASAPATTVTVVAAVPGATTATATSAPPTPTLDPTPSPAATATAAPAATTPLPVDAPRGAVAERPQDPASLTMAGASFILTVGAPRNGIWQPQGSQWLAGTALRRVVAVPYSPALQARLEESRAPLLLRLRDGTVVTYRLTGVRRLRRDQIEVLAADRPAITVILYGEAGDERTVVTGEAIQEKEVVAPPGK